MREEIVFVVSRNFSRLNILRRVLDRFARQGCKELVFTPTHFLDPRRRHQHFLARPPIGGRQDDVTNGPGFFIENEPMHVPDVAICSFNVISSYRLRAAEVGIVDAPGFVSVLFC